MDRFSDFPTNLVAPARDGATVVPDDSLDLAQLPRALFIGSTGDVSVTLAGGQALVFRNCAAGGVLPVRARRVHASGTTATAIVALW